MKNFYLELTGLALVTLALSSCSIKDDTETVGSRSGYFILKWVDQGKEVASTYSTNLKSSTTDFMLGDLKSSKEFFFLLSNGGEEDIFSISLDADDEAVIVTPSHINSLPGSYISDVSESTGLIPLITLGVVHGTQLNGVGYAPLLEMGNHPFRITISGKILDGNDTISVTGDFDFKVFARVMDIRIEYDGTELDLTKSIGGISTNLGGLGFMRYYEIPSGQVEIFNTGNVLFDLSLAYGNTREWEVSALSLDEGSSGTIELDDRSTYLRMDSEGTITDDERIQLGNDGYGYLMLRRIDESEPGDSTSVENDSIQ